MKFFQKKPRKLMPNMYPLLNQEECRIRKHSWSHLPEISNPVLLRQKNEQVTSRYKGPKKNKRHLPHNPIFLYASGSPERGATPEKPAVYMPLQLSFIQVRTGQNAEHSGPANQGREYSARCMVTSKTRLVHTTATVLLVHIVHEARRTAGTSRCMVTGR